MDVAYVTRNTYKRLSGAWLQLDGEISLDRIFDFIFDESLKPILSEREAVRLYIQKKMFENEYQSLRVVEPSFSPKYVFKVNPPKFHKSDKCELLRADFKNYLVPLEIKELGDEKVAEFQEFCQQTKEEFADKSDDVFWAHVGAKFRVRIRPESVLYANSGIQDIEGMSFSELQRKIRRAIESSKNMINGADGATIKRLRYAPNRQRALSTVINSDARSVMKSFYDLKIEIINSLFELYKKQAHANEYVLPVSLLQACGLGPCKGCHK